MGISKKVRRSWDYHPSGICPSLITSDETGYRGRTSDLHGSFDDNGSARVTPSWVFGTISTWF
ncbi:hypothetical protein Plhal304r1_c029g0094571 [Plasmopara halstedii]